MHGTPFKGTSTSFPSGRANGLVITVPKASRREARSGREPGGTQLTDGARCGSDAPNKRLRRELWPRYDGGHTGGKGGVKSNMATPVASPVLGGPGRAASYSRSLKLFGNGSRGIVVPGVYWVVRNETGGFSVSWFCRQLLGEEFVFGISRIAGDLPWHHWRGRRPWRVPGETRQ